MSSAVTMPAVEAAVAPATRSPGAFRVDRASVLRALLGCVTGVVSLIGCWWLFVALVDTSPLIARSPADVFRSLTTRPGADELRHRLATNLATTLGHTGVGLLAGIVLACVLATIAVCSRTGAYVIRPAAVAMRSTPMVAAAPILSLIFGRGIVDQSFTRRDRPRSSSF